MSQAKVKVGTYNVHNDEAGGLPLHVRAKPVADILASHLGIWGVQEARVQYLETFRDIPHVRIVEGAIVGKDQVTPILYNRLLLKLVSEGSFYLGEDPTKKAPAWGAKDERSATWAIFELLSTRQRILFLNTHLDNQSELARVNGMKLVLEFLRTHGKMAAFVTADYNSSIYAPKPDVPYTGIPYQLLYAAKFRDAYVTCNGEHAYPVPNTFHNFEGSTYESVKEEFGTHYTDYIMGRFCRFTMAKIGRDNTLADKASDHYPVYGGAEVDTALLPAG